MIIAKKTSNILDSDCTNICFAINIDGYNDAGFASIIGRNYWQEIIYPGEQKLGTILKKEAKGRVFYAIACHSLQDDGWKETPRIVKEALDKIGGQVGCVLMGGGPIGQMMGADARAILDAMNRSTALVEVYSLNGFPE